LTPPRKHIASLFKKDLLLEIRQQYSFYGILIYISSTIFVLYLAIGSPESNVWNGLFWMIQIFVCVNAVAKSFLQESPGRALYYYSISGPRQYIASKLLFNAMFMTVMSLCSLLLFQLLLGNPLTRFAYFAALVVLGAISLSLVFTFLAAIASRAKQNAALMAILGFPLIIPQLLLLMRLSNSVFYDVLQAGSYSMMLVLSGFDVLVIALALILFPFLWKD
jgi:heme exporter protein B